MQPELRSGVLRGLSAFSILRTGLTKFQPLRMAFANQRIGIHNETYLALSNSLYPAGSRLQQHTDGSAKSNAQGYGGAAGYVDGNADDHPHSNYDIHSNTHGHTNCHTDTDNYTFPCS